MIVPVEDETTFKNDSSFYRFAQDKDAGTTDELSWHLLHKLESRGVLGGDELISALIEDSDLT